MAGIHKQNGGTRGVALTTQQINGSIGNMVARHVVQLSEHLSSVQIIGTRVNEDGSTSKFCFGSGDIYARTKLMEVVLHQIYRDVYSDGQAARSDDNDEEA